MTDGNDAQIAVVVKCWPRLSETFIAQEMAGLEARGLKLVIYSLRLPTDPAIHPVHARVKAPIVYLPEYLKNDPLRVLRAWWKARKLPGYRAARARFLHDLVRDRTPNRIRRFGQGLVLAAEMPAGIKRMYAHFIHTPASATRYAAIMRGLPWSASAHAKDIWTSQEWELRAKLADIDWLITCTQYALGRLKELVSDQTRLRLVYHGLDLANLPMPPAQRSRRDGSDPKDPVVILSVGRRVAKKGYDDLLAALAMLPKDINWRFEHIGAGVLGDSFEHMAEQLGIGDRCVWHGARPQAEVFAAYQRADIFVLASKTADDGDREGMPNVLQEAGYQRMAILSTRSAAIGEFITDGDNGLMADPAAPDQLAAGLEKLARDPDLRARFGMRANEVVRTRFSYEAGVDWIARSLALPAHADLTPQIEIPEARAAE
ncbi:Glycosyltransferase involved in cell wall bisynthesis [Enhydrobacter aerosaccus]|uniref:Glycosyltransferase involved in cell wall bisynthesis n=1 Tax=Enhydrobacter aerosaccus TaxID=225324 RepID=A0A1T4QP58_9HYPH|nr:glycosyltransferase family 4 protein [Enhydrobacter aerosaccus]SKA05251.1 Glycosyltransferase involved in cell wall bisynthesis [Enhydrobacter aerosaccus]